MEVKRTPTLSKPVLSALRLLELGKGKSVSQLSSEFELTNSDVVCVVMPFVRAGLVGHRTVTEDWRDDVYYSLNYEREIPAPPAEDELKKLKDELVESRDDLRRLQVDLASKEESSGKAHRLVSVKDLHLEEGKTLSQIAIETGMSSARAQEFIELLVKSGEIVQKYISKGQFTYVAAKKLKDFLPTAADIDARNLKDEVKSLKNVTEQREEALRKRIKLEILESLDIGKGRSAGQIAAKTGMSIADVVGTMMTFVRSGLIEQSFTPQGFFYVPAVVSGEIAPTVVEEKIPTIQTRAVEELASKQVVKEFVTPSETRAGVQLFTPADTHTRIELFEDLFPKLTVKELVLLREKINMELRKR
jgi:DNA-binding MarR family transcriptional regulator/predicted transcriptional regulator